MMDYKSIIESKYNRQNWQLLLHDIFGSRANLQQQPFKVETSSNLAKNALCLGKITLSDEQTIAVYEVELSDSVDIERNRRGIRDMLASAWRGMHAGAFMFCYRNDESVLRFSYVSESWTFAEDGTYQKESTDTKRFTYLLGEGHRSRTAIQQFEKLRDSSLTLKDLTKAFSVDAVSDMFFDGYKKQYEDIICYATGKRMVKVANKWEEKQVGNPNPTIMQEFERFDNPEKAVRDYVKKLMGRLVFLQFLQKKGWLGVPVGGDWGEGDTEFIQNLFAQTTDKEHFIDNVLEALFNDLNSEDNKQLKQYRIPYLNGGLFERDATDETRFPLKVDLMRSLLDFFASYNFTIDENDPNDAEVGVDPEMLGRIFENLLEDNKDKGAFYTPKEIVTYMCRESLIAYLQTGIEDEATKEALRQFVTTHDVETLGTNKKFHQQVDEALKAVKICDPAIGSGAFPMGLLKELFLCRTALEGIEQNKAAEIKKHIIQQNIYGVDIEKGAVDIARLRFWLSLIVDEETPQALPNLDFKIMQGNSLLEQYKGVDFSTMTDVKWKANESLSIFDNILDVHRRDMRVMISQYYDCVNHNKKNQLKEMILNNVQNQLLEQQINIKVLDDNLIANNQYFLWHTWFYDVFLEGGFDIVIANPPYIGSKGNESIFHKVQDTPWGNKYFERWMDYFYFFIHKGLDIISDDGILCYITTNYYFTATGATKLRTRMKQSTIYKIVDFGEMKLFESALGQHNAITILKKKANIQPTKIIRFNSCGYKSNHEIAKMLSFGSKEIDSYSKSKDDLFSGGDNQIILSRSDILENGSSLTKAISKGSVPLSNYALVTMGIVTLSDVVSNKHIEKFNLKTINKGDGIYVLSNQELNALGLKKEDYSYIKPFYKNSDIQKYYTEHVTDKWLIYVKDEGIPIHLPEPLNKHFEKFKPIILALKENFLKNEIAAAVVKKWLNNGNYFVLFTPKKEEYFTSKKIVAPYRCKENIFSLSDAPFFASKDVAYIIPFEETLLPILLGILNSKLILYWLKTMGKKKGDVLELYAKPLNDIPIKIPTNKNLFTDVVYKIIDAKKKKKNSVIEEINLDKLVYHLYGLTYEEVLIVDPETPITKEEYDKQK